MTQTPVDDQTPFQRYAELGLGAAMLALAFIGIAASDISGGGSQALWTGIVVAFALASVALDWIHPDRDVGARALVRFALHWIGVLAAVELVFLLASTGRIMNADDGLTNALILALGAFLGGVHGNWRLMVLGAGLGVAVAFAALMEQYMWVVGAVLILSLAAVYLVGRFRSRP